MPSESKGPSDPPPPTIDPDSLDPIEIAGPPTARRGEFGLTADGRLKSGKLAGLSMNAAIWVLAWPVLVDSLLGSMVGLTDTVMAARISEAATDAIGNASYFLWFLGLAIIAMDVGATALVSRSIGAGRTAVASAAVGQTMLLAIAVGLVLGVLVALSAGMIAAGMNMSPEAERAFVDYMRIIAFDVPFMALLYAGIACVRGAGDTFRPMRVMVVVNIVNVLGCWTLGGVEGSPETILPRSPIGINLGVTGIALATLLAHGVGSAMILTALIRGVAGLRLRRRRMRPHWHTLRRLVRVGIPNFLETFGMWVGNFILINMVGWLGVGLVGAHIIAVRIEGFSYQPGFAIGIAAATLAGQYIGAGSPRLARLAVLRCALLASAMMGVTGVLFMAMPRAIVGLLSSQPTHLEVTPPILFIAGIVQIPFALGIVLRSAMRGAGDVRIVMYLTWLTTWAVRLPLAYLLCGVDIPVPSWAGGGVIPHPFPSDLGLWGLWLGMCIELVIRAGLFGARFVHGGWARMRV